jgi:MFS family permease
MPRSDGDEGVRRPSSAHKAQKAAGRGLDWLNLFVANVQTGFGPFLSVYLTTAGWTQTSIGIALSLGTITAMASQVPAGALVDAVRRKTLVALFSILAFTASALFFTIAPIPLFVYLGQVLHAFSSCTLGPAIVALSLAVAGQAALALRLGRNARFGAIGNAIGAALMGAVGYYISERSVFFVTAALTIPALVAIVPLARLEKKRTTSAQPVGRQHRKTAKRRREQEPGAQSFVRVLGDKRLLIFATCAALFTFANAAMLPLASSAITKQVAGQASLLIAACIVLPQLVMALLSPRIGQLAETHGRKSMLLLGFGILPLRGVLLALLPDPTLVILVQVLDGITAACFGVMVPLVVADVAGRSGHLNLSLGFVGFAIGIGATLSTTVAGWIADHYGDPAAFFSLASMAAAALLLVWLAMPETRPTRAQT